MLFITAFKSFKNNNDGASQRSALYTWAANGARIVAPNNESDIKENCQRFPSVKLLPGIRTARDFHFQHNSPVLKDLLLRGLDEYQDEWVVLINSDVLLPRDFYLTLKDVGRRYRDNAFIAVTRYDIDLFYEVDTHQKHDAVFTEEATIYNEHCSSDVFISRRENFLKMAKDMPPFILGRYGWDNWIHYYVYVNFYALNGTRVFKTLHCRHNHQHIEMQEGRPGRYALSSVHNLTLLRNMQNLYGQSIRINRWPYVEI